jgi:hypothetical protein
MAEGEPEMEGIPFSNPILYRTAAMEADVRPGEGIFEPKQLARNATENSEGWSACVRTSGLTVMQRSKLHVAARS